MLAAARATLGRRLVVAFQPHRYSRTQQLMDAFGPSLPDADEIVLTDIYAAGEDPIPGVTIEALADAIRSGVGPPGARRQGSSTTSCPTLLTIGAAGRRRDHAGRRLDRHAAEAHLMRGTRSDARRDALMPVAAPADKRFRRAHVSPTRRRALVGVRRGGRSASRGRAACVVGFGVYRAVGSGARRRRADRDAHHGQRQRAAVARRSAGAARRPSRAEHARPSTSSAWRQKLLTSPWVADAALRRVLPGTVDVVDRPSASRWASAASATRCTSIDQQRRDHRRVRSQLRGVRPADHRRPAPRRRAQAARSIDDARAALAARAARVAAAAARSGARACRRSTSRDVARRRRDSQGRHGAGPRRRRRSSSSACSRTSISRRRCASGCRASTTWICGSTSACTSRPHVAGRRNGSIGGSAGGQEDQWHEESGIWSGSTSARRRVVRRRRRKPGRRQPATSSASASPSRAASSAAWSSTSRRRSSRSRRRSRKPS